MAGPAFLFSCEPVCLSFLCVEPTRQRRSSKVAEAQPCSLLAKSAACPNAHGEAGQSSVECYCTNDSSRVVNLKAREPPEELCRC